MRPAVDHNREPDHVWDSLLAQTECAIAKRASLYYPETGDTPVSIARLPFARRSSFPIYLLELRAASIRRKIIVKFAPVFQENNEGKTEFENMTRLWNRPERHEPGLGFVRPLDFIPDTNAVISEFVEGEKFSLVLLRNSCLGAPPDAYGALQDAATRAGRWLRVMHDAAPAGTPTLAQTSAAREFDALLDAFTPSRLLAGQVGDLRAFLKTILPALGGLPAPVALVHGDYGPGNMAWGGDGRIYVFDLQYNTTDVVYQDLAYFLVSLRTLNPYPTYPLFSRRKAVALEQPFMHGYFGRSLERHERLLLRFFYLRNLVQRALRHFTDLSSRRHGPIVARVAVGMMYPGLLRREMQRVTALAEALHR